MSQEIIDQVKATLEELYRQVEKNPRRGGYGSFTMPDGTQVNYYQCVCDPDDPSNYIDHAILDYEEYLRELEPLFDPNKIDSRRVRRELGDKLINLGLRASRVKSNRRRLSMVS